MRENGCSYRRAAERPALRYPIPGGGIVNYIWGLIGVCAFDPKPTIWDSVVQFNELGVPSTKYLEEQLRVTVTLKVSLNDETKTYTCSLATNFTVVAVSVDMPVIVSLRDDKDATLPLTLSILPTNLPRQQEVSISSDFNEFLYEDKGKTIPMKPIYIVKDLPRKLYLDTYIGTEDQPGIPVGQHELTLSHEDSRAAYTVKLTVIKVEMAMDGDRNDSIDFDDPDDAKYLFWVNDDVDVISGGEEDDSQVGTANSNDKSITCKRDLEDFTRLHIKVDETTADLSGITYFLKFENVSSESPSINLFEAIGESLAYLFDSDVAAQQIKKTKLITVGENAVQLPNKYIKTGGQVSPFILEGKTAGKGDLTIIVKKDGKEICKKAVNLDLRPITGFYERYIVTISSGDEVNTTSSGNINSTTYKPETDEYIIHVHGWNMAQWEKNRWTETMFKRLWWQKYKGHVGGFQWPTYTGILSYDASELRAWRSGEALNNRITSLNSMYPGEVRVLAHSMGNVVMGEALRLFSSSVVHTYIAAQAAIPAHCYDNTIGNYWTGFNTPNIYARYSSGQLPDTPYLVANSRHAETMLLYFNPVDYALGARAWQLNNELKPDYAYWNTDGDSNIDSYEPASGDRFYFNNALLPFGERTITIPDQRFEAFARILESRSNALGCEPSVAGFGTARDLQNWNYNNQHYSHSREFRSNIVDESPFWAAVIEDAHLNE